MDINRFLPQFLEADFVDLTLNQVSLSIARHAAVLTAIFNHLS